MLSPEVDGIISPSYPLGHRAVDRFILQQKRPGESWNEELREDTQGSLNMGYTKLTQKVQQKMRLSLLAPLSNDKR